MLVEPGPGGMRLSGSMRIGTALANDDPFWVQVSEAARQRAEELGVTLIPVQRSSVRAGDESLGFLEELKAHELGALIAPLVSQSITLNLLDAGLPLVCGDETPLRHPLLVSPQGLYNAAVLAAEYLAQRLGGVGRILLVGGPEQNPYTARVRLEGFRHVMRRYPDLQHTRIPTLWRYEEVYAQIVEEADLWRRAIAAGPVDAIFGLSDPVALAARDAGRALGFVDDRTLIGGINGDPLAVAAILQGTMHCSAATSPRDFGRQLVEYGVRAANGEPLPDTFPFLIELITADNVVDVAARKLVDIAALPSRLVDVNVQQERQRLKQMETSLELNRYIGAILDEDELLRTLADIICSRYAYDHVQLFLWNRDEQQLVLVDPRQPVAARAVFALEDAGALGHAFLRNQAIYIPDVANSQRFAPDPRWPELRARVILPIRLGRRTLGLLDLHCRKRTVRTQAELDALQMLADQVGNAMHNVQRYSRAVESTLEAERSSQMKSRLLANISHELRGPLNVILGYSQAALTEPNPYNVELPAELRQDLRYVEQSGEDLLRLINDLIDLAQAESGSLPLYPEEISIGDFLTRIFADARKIYAVNQAVNWRLLLPGDLPAVYADPVRLRSVLLNLLDNAARFTARGQIVMSVAVSATHLVIQVQDTGRGIEPQRLAQIKQGLVMDEPESGDGVRHVGLGLRIAYHLVKLHGGDFNLESEPGRGATCRLCIPLHPAPAAAQPAGAALAAAADRTSVALVQKIHDFVAAHYMTPFTREDLAGAVGVSEAYVSRVFRRVTGCSLWEFVNQYRVRSACELLDRTAMSVTEIALAAGFSDPAYFSRVFRSEIGQSPQSYRKCSTQ